MIDVENFIRKRLALYRAYDIRLERQRQARDGHRDGHQSVRRDYGPYLLISREKGAGGSAVAQRVGALVGWQVFNDEIIDAIAQKARVRRELVESLDERDRTAIHDVVARLLRRQPMGLRDYLAHLQEVLLTLGRQGQVVIVGRSADYVLPSQHGLRVHMVAPLEVRVGRIAHREKLSNKAARAAIAKVDRERKNLARKHYRRDWADPLHHDLTINTAELTVQAVAEIVITSLKQKLGPSFGKGCRK